jgi:hypothetical protein
MKIIFFEKSGANHPFFFIERTNLKNSKTTIKPLYMQGTNAT